MREAALSKNHVKVNLGQGAVAVAVSFAFTNDGSIAVAWHCCNERESNFFLTVFAHLQLNYDHGDERQPETGLRNIFAGLQIIGGYKPVNEFIETISFNSLPLPIPLQPKED